MRRLPLAATLSLAVAAALLTSASSADAAHEKPELTVTLQPSSDGKTQDLHVVVHGVTDYCSTDADTRVMRNSETIRIIRDRPQRASRCMADAQDRAFVVKDVGPGRYVVTYERMPLVAPARPIRVAWTNIVINGQSSSASASASASL